MNHTIIATAGTHHRRYGVLRIASLTRLLVHDLLTEPMCMLWLEVGGDFDDNIRHG